MLCEDLDQHLSSFKAVTHLLFLLKMSLAAGLWSLATDTQKIKKKYVRRLWLNSNKPMIPPLPFLKAAQTYHQTGVLLTHSVLLRLVLYASLVTWYVHHPPCLASNPAADPWQSRNSQSSSTTQPMKAPVSTASRTAVFNLMQGCAEKVQAMTSVHRVSKQYLCDFPKHAFIETTV